MPEIDKSGNQIAAGSPSLYIPAEVLTDASGNSLSLPANTVTSATTPSLPVMSVGIAGNRISKNIATGIDALQVAQVNSTTGALVDVTAANATYRAVSISAGSNQPEPAANLTYRIATSVYAIQTIGVDSASQPIYGHGPSAYFTLLASAVRNSTTTTPTQTNPGYRGVQVYLNITAAGTAALTPQFYVLDALGNAVFLGNGTARSTTGTFGTQIFSGGASTANGNITCFTVSPGRQWYVQIAAGDSTNYTYSITACYFN